MSPKIGQKLTDNPKDTMLRTRVDKETVDKLEYVSSKLGVSKSEVIRRGIADEYQKLQK